MDELPAPTMVTTSFSMVATSVFELVYVNAPELLELGVVNVKVASPMVFGGTEKLDSAGVP